MIWSEKEWSALRKVSMGRPNVDEVLSENLELLSPDLMMEAGGHLRKRDRYIVRLVDVLLNRINSGPFKMTIFDGVCYVYNGSHWMMVTEVQLTRFLKDACEKMGAEHENIAFYKWGNDLSEQLRSTAPLAVTPDEAMTKINLANVTLEMDGTTIHSHAHEHSDFLRYTLDFDFDPEATAPVFQRFLDEVLPDRTLQDVLAEFVGYIFIPQNKMRLEKVLLLYGTGSNGKSVVFQVVNALLGEDNVTNYSLSSITDKNGYTRAALSGKLLNYSSDSGDRMEAAIFKQMGSGEPVEARNIYGSPFIMRNYARFMFNVNNLPKNVEHNEAFFRRFLIIPFEVTIKKEEQDIHLADKIIENELPGILNWALEGMLRVLKNNGFSDCDIINRAIEDYRNNSNSVRTFVEDTGVEKSMNDTVTLEDLYNLYDRFCKQNNYRAFSKRNFSSQLKAMGFEETRNSRQTLVYAIIKNNPETTF